jgi:hypothetical protein
MKRSPKTKSPASRFSHPASALYQVTCDGKIQRTDRTETRLSDFRRYGSTQSVQFDEAAIPFPIPANSVWQSK